MQGLTYSNDAISARTQPGTTSSELQLPTMWLKSVLWRELFAVIRT